MNEHAIDAIDAATPFTSTDDSPEPADLVARARRVLPGGVNSPARAWHAVGGVPRFLVRGSGARVWDESGTEYLDFVCGWGALLFGHAYAPVVAAVRGAARGGLTLGMPTRIEVEYAEAFLRLVPWAEQVRVANSGTEAVMTALRLARAATGRPFVLRFEGNYHGHSDGCLGHAGERRPGAGVDASGITRAAAADALVAPYDDTSTVAALLARHDERVAAILVEPVAANMGVVVPSAGFLRRLRELCDRAGALLIVDEVVTGFRLGPAGASTDIAPDLGVYGKIAGGGAPFGAVAGPRHLLSRLAPEGPVFHAGTFAGNALTMAAGLAQLRAIEADPGVYARLDALGAALEAGLASLVARHGYPVHVARAGSLWWVAFAARSAGARRSPHGIDVDAARFARFFHGMLRRGIHLAPSPFEAHFLSAAHGESDVARTLQAAAGALEDAHA